MPAAALRPNMNHVSAFASTCLPAEKQAGRRHRLLAHLRVDAVRAQLLANGDGVVQAVVAHNACTPGRTRGPERGNVT